MTITALVVSLSKMTKANTHTRDTTNHVVNEFSELITYSWKGNLISQISRIM